MGLSKHSDPVLPHLEPFLELFFELLRLFAIPTQQRMWLVALCRLREGSIWVAKCNSVCSCVLGCMLACCFVLSCFEGWGWLYVCNMCSVVRAAQ